MRQRTSLAGAITLGYGLLISAAASAQVTPPDGTFNAVPEAPSAATLVPSASSAREPQLTVLQRNDTDALLTPEGGQQQLRAQLADPVQRERVFAARLRQQRASHPDFARVLRIDADTETKLLSLLVDQQLADELRTRPLQPGFDTSLAVDLLQQDAQSYDEHIREITKLIGAAQLDTYLDYDRLRYARLQVQQFDATLPTALKLTSEQKDAFAPLLLPQNSELSLPRRAFGTRLDRPGAALQSREDLQRRMKELQIVMQEQLAADTEASSRAVIEQLPRFLLAEQTKAYVQYQSNRADSLRTQARGLRRDAGIGADEKLAKDDTDLAVTPDLRLSVQLSINGRDLRTVVTSKRGQAVMLDAPEGLLLEIQPTQTTADQFSIELRFYESSNAGRRLIGQSYTSTRIGDLQQPALLSNGTDSSRTLMRGRKAYLLDWSIAGDR